jgi:hypothetical protein
VPPSSSSCSSKTLFTIDSKPVKQLTGDTAFYYSSGLNIDADGAPNAYSPNDTGIDYLANAGSPGNWWGIATDGSGKPYIQGYHHHHQSSTARQPPPPSPPPPPPPLECV